MTRLRSLRDFYPFLYHPVGGEKLANCELIDMATGLYRFGDRELLPIVLRDDEGFILTDHWKRDPRTGHKWRKLEWPPIEAPVYPTGGGWVFD